MNFLVVFNLFCFGLQVWSYRLTGDWRFLAWAAVSVVGAFLCADGSKAND